MINTFTVSCIVGYTSAISTSLGSQYNVFSAAENVLDAGPYQVASELAEVA